MAGDLAQQLRIGRAERLEPLADRAWRRPRPGSPSSRSMPRAIDLARRAGKPPSSGRDVGDAVDDEVVGRARCRRHWQSARRARLLRRRRLASRERCRERREVLARRRSRCRGSPPRNAARSIGSARRAGQRAQHDRADRHAGLLRQRVHVEEGARCRPRPRPSLRGRRIEPAIAHRHLFLDQEDAMRRGDRASVRSGVAKP